MKAYLTYALNQEGKLVHVDNVPNGKECGCICPACKKPLQAKNGGQVREHYFAHQPGVDCPTALETTLHFLAKDKIQRAFYEKKFNIEFEYRSYCTNAQSCHYIIATPQNERCLISKVSMTHANRKSPMMRLEDALI